MHTHLLWKCVSAMNWSFCLFVCSFFSCWKKKRNLSLLSLTLFCSLFSVYVLFLFDLQELIIEKGYWKYFDTVQRVSLCQRYIVFFIVVLVDVVPCLTFYLHRPSCTFLWNKGKINKSMFEPIRWFEIIFSASEEKKTNLEVLIYLRVDRVGIR